MKAVVLLLSLVLAVNPAVYGWLGALRTWSGKEADRNERLVYLLIAGAFMARVWGARYAPTFVVRTRLDFRPLPPCGEWRRP